MPKCLFDKSTKLFVGGTAYDDLPHDTATHIQLTLANYPDRRDERWDGAVGVRAATAQELIDYDNANRDVRATTNLDTAINKTLRDLLLDIEQRLRAAGQISIIPDIAAATNKAEYRAALKDIIKSYL